MRKPILLLSLFLWIAPALANRFQLLETGARFVLDISKTELRYQSETLKKEIEIKPCNFKLINQLNLELLHTLNSPKSLVASK